MVYNEIKEILSKGGIKMKKRIFSGLIALVMLLAMIPALSVAHAEEVINWPSSGNEVTIGGETYMYIGYTNGGLDFYCYEEDPDDRVPPVAYRAGDGYLLWDGEDTLTLHNVTLTEAVAYAEESAVLAMSEGTIVLEGENRIAVTYGDDVYTGDGIILYDYNPEIEGHTIKGPGSLEIEIEHTGDPEATNSYESYGIYAIENLSVEGATLSLQIDGEDVQTVYGIYGGGAMEVTDAKIVADPVSDKYACGIHLEDDLIAQRSTILGSIASRDTDEYESSNYIDFIEVYGSIDLIDTIVKADLTTTNRDCYGLYATSGISMFRSAATLSYKETEHENYALGCESVAIEESYLRIDGGYCYAYGNWIEDDEYPEGGYYEHQFDLVNSYLARPAGAELLKDVPYEDWGVCYYVANADGTMATDIMITPANYSDVAAEDWFAPAAGFTTATGLFAGAGNNTFAPTKQTNRVTLMVVLARMSGVDTTAAPGQPWYQKGLEWAMANGVSDGTNPLGNINRQQIASMLYRLAGEPGADLDVLDEFNDAGQIADWAKEAVAWAVENGILSGKGNGILDPRGNATRAQVAQMMMNYVTIK